MSCSHSRVVLTFWAAAFECPQQTGARADCASCMACSRMKGGTILALRPHGPGKRPTRAMRAKLDGYRRSGAEGLSGGPGGAGGVAR